MVINKRIKQTFFIDKAFSSIAFRQTLRVNNSSNFDFLATLAYSKRPGVNKDLETSIVSKSLLGGMTFKFFKFDNTSEK